MAVAARVSRASVRAGSRIDAELQSLGVDVVGERLHVGKLVVGVDDAAGVAVAFPGVVDVEVDVASVTHSAGDESVGHFAHGFVVDASGEEVPTVPSHGRGLGEAVGWKIVERRRRQDVGYEEWIGLRAFGDEFFGLVVGLAHGDVQLVALQHAFIDDGVAVAGACGDIEAAAVHRSLLDVEIAPRVFDLAGKLVAVLL